MITCHFEGGNEGHLRHAVADMLVIQDNKILMVKRAEGYLEGGKYALPGGFVDRDETAAQAAVRETQEETGYNSEVITLFRIVDNPRRRGEDRQNIAFVYLMKPLEKMADSDKEVTETVWFDLDKLPPSEQVAFDHLDNIELYKKHLKEPFMLPILNK